MDRKCLICNNPLIKRAHESQARFLKKRFCSASCSRVWMKKNRVGWWNLNSKNMRTSGYTGPSWDNDI